MVTGIGGRCKIEIALWGQLMAFRVEYIEGESVDVDSSAGVDLRLAVDLKIQLILTVVYLRLLFVTFEYSWPISSLRILRRVASFLL
jgi:hypothetical protein